MEAATARAADTGSTVAGSRAGSTGDGSGRGDGLHQALTTRGQPASPRHRERSAECSERREHEMDEVIATLDTLRVDAIMSKATKAKLHWVTGLGLKAHFKGVPPKEYHQIFAALDGKR